MKKKLLLTSILSVIMCISLIAGATFALFTSEDNVNIAVTSATIKVSAEIDESSVQTKQLNQDYVSGVNGLFEGEAVFTTDANDVQTLTLDRLVPGDAIKFNIVVKNSSNVTVKYRTVISCLNDDGLFAGLNVNIGDIQNYNGDKYVANWQVMEEGSQDIIIPVVIELPEDAGNEYQTKTCTLNYFVEAVQGNAPTTNESQKVEVSANATESINLQTNGNDSPIIGITPELVQDLADAGVSSVGIKHSEAIIEGNTISYDTFELVDENGNEIDLEEMGNDVEVPVSLPAVPSLANQTVYVYHDGVAVATVVADENGVVSYTVTHFCEIAVSTKLIYNSAVINSSNDFTKVFAKAKGDFTLILNSDVEITKQVLITNKDLKLTIDLNGFDINANVPTSEVFQVQSNNNGLTLKSSKAGSQINVGGKALVLAYNDVNVSNVEINVDEIKSSSYQTFKMQKGDLTIGKDTVVNVKFLGTSLINCSKSVVIDGATINVQQYRTNAGEILGNYASTKVSINNSNFNIVLDPTYNQYFVCGYAENVEIANSNVVVSDLAGASYELTNANGNIGFKKIGYVVNSYEELSSVCANVANGETIIFGADIESANGVLITDKNITIDLNGYTFTVTDGANVNNRAFKINGSSVVTVKNGTIIADGAKDSGAYGSVRTEGSAKVTLDSLVLRNYRGGGLNVKALAGTEVTINNCEIYAQYGGGVEASGGDIVLNNTTIDQQGVYGNGWYSVAMVIHSGAKITVNSGNYSGCAIETDSNASMGNCVAFILSSGGTLDIYGGTFYAKVAETATAANFCGIICADRAAIVNIYGGTFLSTGAILDMRNNAGTLPNPVATIYGGTFSADPSVSGLYSSNLITIADGADITIDNCYGVSTVDGLKYVRDLVNAGKYDSKKPIKLFADIDLNNENWEPMGNAKNPFKGTFDGQGYTISNLYINIDDSRDSIAFFGYASNATIKNFTIKNVNVYAEKCVAAFVGDLTTGTISNCHVKGDISIVARSNYASGIVSWGYCEIENCSVIADEVGYITSAAVAGGICARNNEGSNSIKDCIVKNMDVKSGQQIAAICGFVHYGNTVSGCEVENVNLTLTAQKPMAPAIGLVCGLWYYKEDALITMSNNTFKDVTISAITDVTGETDILFGWEWNDHLSGIVAENNVQENVVNNLNYQA